MRKFATVSATDSPFKVTLWQESDDGSCEVVEHYPNLSSLDDDVEVWSFEVRTSVDVMSGVNASRHPVLDSQGGPLWAGCEVEFVRPTYYVNWEKGDGTLVKVDGYGYAQVASARPMAIRDRNGAIVAQSRDLVLPMAKYHHDGPYKGAILLIGALGDRHEHGQVPVFVRRLTDPRLVYKLLEPCRALSL